MTPSIPMEIAGPARLGVGVSLLEWPAVPPSVSPIVVVVYWLLAAAVDLSRIAQHQLLEVAEVESGIQAIPRAVDLVSACCPYRYSCLLADMPAQ